jgi:hypothetical protein
MRKKKIMQIGILFRDPGDLSYNLKDTPLDTFLKWFEDEAKEILIQGGYSTDISDLWYMLKENYPRADERTLHAANILLSASQLSYLAKKTDDEEEQERRMIAKEAAIDMLKLISSAINIGLEDPIKRMEWSSRGGKATGRNEVLDLLIQEALKKSKHKTQNALWGYIKRNHAIKPGNDAFYSKAGVAEFITKDDPYWDNKPSEVPREGILTWKKGKGGMKRQLRDVTTEIFVPFSTFKRNVSEAKRRLASS